MLIGGRQTTVNLTVRQQGFAPDTTLRSAAIAAGWVGSAYALSFTISGSTYVAAFEGSFGTAQVVNSSYGYSNPAGSNPFTIYSDGMAWAHPRTLYVVSAGNAGPSADSVGAPGSGYDTLTAAALGNPNTFNSVSGFSSRGPQSFGYVTRRARHRHRRDRQRARHRLGLRHRGADRRQRLPAAGAFRRHSVHRHALLAAQP
jgi:hypothetical protein